MTIIKCKECGNNVSTDAKSCPSCGAKVKKAVGVVGWAIAIIIVAFFVKVSLERNTADNRAAAAEAAKTPEQKALEEKLSAEQENRHLVAVAALRTIKKSLRDPSSVEWETVLVNQDGTTACIQYRAKNGFGGFSKEFALFQNGKPSQNETQWNKQCAGKKMFDNMNSRLAVN